MTDLKDIFNILIFMNINKSLAALTTTALLAGGCGMDRPYKEDWKSIDYVSIDCPPTDHPTEGCKPHDADSLAAMSRSRGGRSGR